MSNYLEKFEKMRIAGSLASKTLDMITDYVKEGTSTNHIDKLCYEFIRDNGGYSAPQFYRGFEKSICTSLNHVVCHGIPGDRTLQDGDIVNIDVTAIINDHYGDTSRMYTVGDISVKSKKLINVTYESLIKAIKILKPGNKLSVIIDQRDSEGKLLFASQDGEKIQLNTKNLLISYLKHPLMTFKVISAIHFEALRLWLKRIRFIKKELKIKNNVSYENNESKKNI